MHVVPLDLRRPSTVAAVTHILQRCFTPESVPRICAEKRWWGVVDAEQHLLAVGSLEGNVLWDVGVHPRQRKRGIATHLVRHLCDTLPVVRLFLADAALRPFYARLGFAVDAAAELPPRAVLSMVRRNAAKEVPLLAAND